MAEARANDDEIQRLQAKVAELESELARRESSQQLRDRVNELEDELTRTRRTSQARSTRERRTREETAATVTRERVDYDRESSRELTDRGVDAVSRAVEESSRLKRGLFLAALEPLRVSANVASAFVDEITQRNRAEQETTVADLVSNLPGDIYSGFVNALDRAVDALPNTVDTFHERYREAAPIRIRRARGETGVAVRAAGVTPRVVATSPPDGAGGPAPDEIRVSFNTEIRALQRDFSSSIQVKSDGAAIAGTESQSGRSALVWRPAAPLSPGTYTVGVFNLESEDGSEMREPHYFTFTVAGRGSDKS